MVDVLAEPWLNEQLYRTKSAYVAAREARTKDVRLWSMRYLMWQDLCFTPRIGVVQLTEGNQKLILEAIESFAHALAADEDRPHKKVDVADKRKARVLLMGIYINSCS